PPFPCGSRAFPELLYCNPWFYPPISAKGFPPQGKAHTVLLYQNRRGISTGFAAFPAPKRAKVIPVPGDICGIFAKIFSFRIFPL
ncbi:MAG: hypothetical protein ACLS4U_05570, partial [Faecalibacterium prausnitzii]